MIKNLIFDFGDVFINLDKISFKKNIDELSKYFPDLEDISNFNKNYERGLVSTDEFINRYASEIKGLTKEDFTAKWNSVLADFPYSRVEFLKNLNKTKKYNIALLSNTNELHIDFISKNTPFYQEFKSLFKSFYLSHEINLIKPNKEIYEFVLKQNNFIAEETLFVDDLIENTKAASKLGI
jgi:glucose-1-phosphatase